MTKRLLAEARDLLKGVEKVATFSGAGLSAESGIATFRDRENDGLWSRFDPLQLASPDGFAADPKRVTEWYNWRRTKLANAVPNPGHIALAAQSALMHITQNVDDLLERAGVPERQIHHLHGTIVKDRCSLPCGYEEAVDLAQPPALRRCPDCDEWLRPAVVWFGERLPAEAWLQAEALCRQIDCLLVIGTSASVFPAAGLIELVRSNGGKIIIVNTQQSEASESADIELIYPAAIVLPTLLEGLELRAA